MKKLILMSLIISSNAFSAAFFVDDGFAAQKNQFRPVVKIHRYSKKGKITGLCTGTLISPKIILTAAHCFTKKSASIRTFMSDDNESLDGIKVKRTIIPDKFLKIYEINKTAEEQLRFPERFTPGEFKKLSIRYKASLALKIAYDLAFLELETSHPSDKSALPKISCKSLRSGDNVLFAGYGVKRIGRSLENSNKNYVLHYGYNKLVEAPFVDFVYSINKNKGFQLTNSGDSGGPLFKKDALKKIYGVTSASRFDKINGINQGAYYGSTSSKYAKEFYNEILNSERASRELQDLVRSCAEQI